MSQQKHKNEEGGLTSSVMQQIESGKVSCRPRWFFTLKNLLLWGSGVFLLLVGALSVSIMILLISGNAWEIRQAVGYTRAGFFIHIFPFVWFGAFILFLFVADTVICKTRGIYRHSPLKISLLILVASIVLGCFFHVCKVSQKIDHLLGNHTPRLYKTLDQRRDSVMHKPQKGHIVGIVHKIDSDDGRFFSIVHPHKKQLILQVDGTEIPAEKLTIIQIGQKILIFGKPFEKGLFHAIDIKPAPPKKFKRHRQEMLFLEVEQGKINYQQAIPIF